jgi:hypothetical protein
MERCTLLFVEWHFVAIEHVLSPNKSFFSTTRFTRMAITCIIEGCGNRQEKQGEGKKNWFHQLPADETNRKNG